MKWLHRNRPNETLSQTDEIIFSAHEDALKLIPGINSAGSTNEGLVMWWELVLSLVLAYPAVEMIEEWRLRRSASKDLTKMREHAASGHKLDATRGQWVG